MFSCTIDYPSALWWSTFAINCYISMFFFFKHLLTFSLLFSTTLFLNFLCFKNDSKNVHKSLSLCSFWHSNFQAVILLMALIFSSHHRQTMTKMGCITWHFSRKSTSPTNLYFLNMVSCSIMFETLPFLQLWMYNY